MKSFPSGTAVAAFFLLFAANARSDEFSLVPSGDVAYRQLAVIAPLGWTELRTQPKTPLTRYEIATEAARAINALQSLRSSTHFFTATPAIRPGIRAVRELADKFRPELRGLGLDAGDAMKLCDGLLRGGEARQEPGRDSASEASFSIAPARREPAGTRPLQASNIGVVPREMRVALPLSSRLRFESMVSKLSRDAADPFGDTNDSASPNVARAGVALSVNNTLSLRAFGGRTAASSTGASGAISDPTRPLNSPSMAFVSSGGGLSVALPRGVQLRGNYERLSAAGGAGDWNRVGGEVEVSAWRNRLSLRANWSRLLPNDARLLPSSAGGLDVGLDVSERLRLTLLYRQLFDNAPETAASRVVSGGININF